MQKHEKLPFRRNLPKNNQQARQILLSHDTYFVSKGILFRYSEKLRPGLDNIEPQWVIPESWVNDILIHTHSSPLGAHIGISKVDKCFEIQILLAKHVQRHLKVCEHLSSMYDIQTHYQTIETAHEN